MNPVEFLKVGGFSPQVSVSAKEALVWQTHDMMFLGGLAWNWSGRLVKSLSNDAFNELNGRKKVELGGAPIDQQLNLEPVKDGLFKLAKPYLEASSNYYKEAIKNSRNDQRFLMNKSMELKEMELEATFTLLGKLPKQMLEMILSGYGALDYESKLKEIPENDPTNKDTWKDGYQPPEDQDFKPPTKPEPTPEPTPVKETGRKTIEILYPMLKPPAMANNQYRVGLQTNANDKSKYTADAKQHKSQMQGMETTLNTQMKRKGWTRLSLWHKTYGDALLAGQLLQLTHKLLAYRNEFKRVYGYYA